MNRITQRAIATISLLLATTSSASANTNDLTGVWLQESRALIYVVDTATGKPKIKQVFALNKTDCVEDDSNTAYMENKLIRASKLKRDGNQLAVYNLPESYPDILVKQAKVPARCQQPLKTSDPKTNFDVLWRFMDSYYPAFDQRLTSKDLTWQALYNKYEKQIKPGMSERDLFNTMGTMLGELHDEHIDLYFKGDPDDDLDINNDNRADVIAFDQAFCDSYQVKKDTRTYIETLGQSIIANLNIIDETYLEHTHHGPELSMFSLGFPAQPVYTWGMIKNTNVGYIRILQELHFEGDHAHLDQQYAQAIKTVDNMMAFFQRQGLAKLIIDIRFNFGGEDAIDNYLVQYLTTKRQVIGQRQARVDGVWQPVDHIYLAPNAHPLRTAEHLFPIVILTSNQTVSSGETLTLDLKALKRVTQIGYKTNGVFASTHTRPLPNGWIFQLPFDKNMSHDGKYYAEIGIPPDIEINPHDNYLMKKYITAQRDFILERALQSE